MNKWTWEYMRESWGLSWQAPFVYLNLYAIYLFTLLCRVELNNVQEVNRMAASRDLFCLILRPGLKWALKQINLKFICGCSVQFNYPCEQTTLRVRGKHGTDSMEKTIASLASVTQVICIWLAILSFTLSLSGLHGLSVSASMHDLLDLPSR